MDTAFEIIENLPHNATSLVIRETMINDYALSFLIEKINDTPSLEEVVLSKCQLTGNSVSRIVSALKTHPNVMRVDLSYNPIYDARHIIPLLSNQKIHDINLCPATDNFDKSSGLEFLSAVIKTQHITALGLPRGISSLGALPDIYEKYLNDLFAMHNLLKVSAPAKTGFEIERIRLLTERNHARATNQLNSLLSKDYEPIDIKELFSSLPSVMAIARETGADQKVFQIIRELGLRDRAHLNGVDTQYLDIVTQNHSKKAFAPSVSETQAAQTTINDGVSEGVSPLRTKDFEHALIFCAAAMNIEETTDILTIVTTKERGGANGLHLLAQVLLEKRSITLHPDHFCQTKGVLQSEFGKAFFSYPEKLKERLSNLFEYMKITGQHFSNRAMLNVDFENNTLITACEKAELIETLFSAVLWKNAPSVLEELLADNTLLPQHKHYITQALQEIDGRERAPLERPPFSTFCSSSMEKALDSVNSLYNLNSIHPLYTIAYGGTSKIDLAGFSSFLEKNTGYPLHADDFVCLRPIKNVNVFSYSDNIKTTLTNMMGYLVHTKSQFTPAIFNIVNGDKKTILEVLKKHGLLQDFFIADYWQHDPKTLVSLAAKETGTTRFIINKCIATLRTMDIDVPIHPSVNLDVIFDESKTFYPNLDYTISLAIDHFVTQQTGETYNNALLGLTVKTKSTALLMPISDLLRESFGRPLVANDFCRKNHKGYAFFHNTDSFATALPVIMSYVKDTKSAFTVEALSFQQGGRSFLDTVGQKGLDNIFFDPEYWRLFPETLVAIARKDKRYSEECFDLLITLGFKVDKSLIQLTDTTSKSSQETSTAPAADTIHHDKQEAESALAKLQEAADKIVIPTRQSLYSYLAAHADSMLGLWRFGDDIIKARQAFAFVAMEVTTSGTMHNGAIDETLAFLRDFSSARTILDEYARQTEAQQQTNAIAPVSTDGFFSRLINWRRFGSEETKTIIDLREAIRLTKNAGATLQNIVPSLDAAGHMAAQKMAMLDTIVQTNNKIIAIIEKHIHVGRSALDDTPLYREDTLTTFATDDAQTAIGTGSAVLQTPIATSQPSTEPSPQLNTTIMTPEETDATVDMLVIDGIAISRNTNPAHLEEPQDNNAMPADTAVLIGTDIVSSQDPTKLQSIRLDEQCSSRLRQRLNLLEEIKATVVSENTAKTLTADLYCKQAATLDLQSGATMANLATQVSGLHGTLDLLQASASSKSLADVTIVANGQQVADLVLTAQRSMTAIAATVESVHASVIDLDKVSLASLTSTNREQLPGASTPVTTITDTTSGPISQHNNTPEEPNLNAANENAHAAIVFPPSRPKESFDARTSIVSARTHQ